MGEHKITRFERDFYETFAIADAKWDMRTLKGIHLTFGQGRRYAVSHVHASVLASQQKPEKVVTKVRVFFDVGVDDVCMVAYQWPHECILVGANYLYPIVPGIVVDFLIEQGKITEEEYRGVRDVQAAIGDVLANYANTGEWHYEHPQSITDLVVDWYHMSLMGLVQDAWYREEEVDAFRKASGYKLIDPEQVIPLAFEQPPIIEEALMPEGYKVQGAVWEVVEDGERVRCLYPFFRESALKRVEQASDEDSILVSEHRALVKALQNALERYQKEGEWRFLY